MSKSSMILRVGQVRELARRTLDYYLAGDLAELDKILVEDIERKNLKISKHNAKMKDRREFFEKWLPKSIFWQALTKTHNEHTLEEYRAANIAKFKELWAEGGVMEVYDQYGSKWRILFNVAYPETRFPLARFYINNVADDLAAITMTVEDLQFLRFNLDETKSDD